MDWPQFLTVLEHISAILGLAGMAAKGVSVLKTKYQDWRDRRARPEDVVRFVTERVSWDRNDLAKRLGISRDDARAILDLFGFEYDRGTQLYVRQQDGRTTRVRSELKDAFEKHED